MSIKIISNEGPYDDCPVYTVTGLSHNAAYKAIDVTNEYGVTTRIWLTPGDIRALVATLGV